MRLMMHVPWAGGRPVDTLLAGYAAGVLSRPLHVLCATHLTMVPKSRAYVEALEILLGDQLEEAAPVEVADRDRKVAAILDEVNSPFGSTALAPRLRWEPDDLLPPPLADFVGCAGADIPWRMVIPGVRRHVIAEDAHGSAELVAVRPGGVVPAHTHEADEVTLVLRGRFEDGSGSYGRGDICVADETVDHRPSADHAEGCVCFIVSGGHLRLTGPIGRHLQRLFGS
jgi:putative transcriptional regulator